MKKDLRIGLTGKRSRCTRYAAWSTTARHHRLCRHRLLQAEERDMDQAEEAKAGKYGEGPRMR
jgi:hypothetical protein